jgi:hypothetical protein
MLSITSIIIILFIICLGFFLYKHIHNQNFKLILDSNGNTDIKNGTNMKPPLFVYVPNETNANKVLDFYGREKHTKDIPILRWCLNSIILHNSSAFTIALIHKNNIKYYLPNLQIRESNTGNLNENLIATSLLHNYGGVFMPINTLCFQPINGLYNNGISYDLTITANYAKGSENISNVELSDVLMGKKGSETLKKLSDYLSTRANGLGGGHSFDEKIKMLLMSSKVQIIPSTVSGKYDMKSREITSQNYSMIIRTKLPDIRHLHFHTLNIDSFRRDNFILKLDSDELLTSNMWITNLVLAANKMEKNLKNEDLPLSGLEEHKHLTIFN